MGSYTLPILFLPRFVREFFGNDGYARLDNLMNQPAMQTLAMGGQFAFLGGQTATGLLVPLAVMPVLLALLDAALGVIVVRIIRTTLAIQFSLETAFLLVVTFELSTEGEKSSFSLLGDNGKGRRAKIKPDECRSSLVLGFLVGHAFQDQLCVVVIALTIRSLSLWRTSPTTQQAHKLDRVIQAMFDDRIIPVNECLDAVLLEEENPRVTFLWPLEDKAQALFVGLALDTIQATATALKADLLRLSQADTIGPLIGSGGQFLRRIAIDVVSNPGRSGLGSVGMEGIFEKP
jgi:hypothetical protein